MWHSSNSFHIPESRPTSQNKLELKKRKWYQVLRKCWTCLAMRHPSWISLVQSGISRWPKMIMSFLSASFLYSRVFHIIWGCRWAVYANEFVYRSWCIQTKGSVFTATSYNVCLQHPKTEGGTLKKTQNHHLSDSTICQHTISSVSNVVLSKCGLRTVENILPRNLYKYSSFHCARHDVTTLLVVVSNWHAHELSQLVMYGS